MENTLGNKAKFFAIYYGQKVRMHKPTYGSFRLVNVEKSTLYWLQLRCLKDITDEDAWEIATMAGYTTVRDHRIMAGKSIAEELHRFSPPLSRGIIIIDFLRSKGYALPWMGLSVEQLIEFGWIKIKN